MKKEDLSNIANEIEVGIPNVIITNETFGFNKAKVQTEISNKRNTTKNDGFEKKQKDENYTIIEKTRNLIAELRRMRKENMERNEKNKIKKIKDDSIFDKFKDGDKNDDADNDGDTTEITAI